MTEGDELGIAWERWSDGLPHRLKRKRDFGDVDPDLVREAAKNAAGRLGKGVQTMVERPPKRKKRAKPRYVWIQFSDHEIRVGDPCKCGGRHLVRIHPWYARCSDCGAQLLAPPKPGEEGTLIEAGDEAMTTTGKSRAAGAGQMLGAPVRRPPRPVRPHRRRQGGLPRVRDDGRDPGVPDRPFPRPSVNERLRARDAYNRAVAVQVLPLRELNGIVDTSALTDPGTTWDLVL